MLLDGKWVDVEPLPGPRTRHALVALEGEFYAIGGVHAVGPIFGGDPRPCECVMVYSPRTNAWRATRMITKARAFPGATACGGKIYVFGGLQPGSFMEGEDLTTAECYDPKTAMWTAIPPMPVGRHGQRCAAVGTRIFVMGGAYMPSADDSAIVMIYDTSARTWETLAKRMPVCEANAHFVVGDRILIIGGSPTACTRPEKEGMHFEDEPDDDPSDRRRRHIEALVMVRAGKPTWALDTLTLTWSPLAPAPRDDGCALYMRDGDWIRSLDQPDLNYHIPTDTWDPVAITSKPKNHGMAAEPATALVPF